MSRSHRLRSGAAALSAVFLLMSGLAGPAKADAPTPEEQYEVGLRAEFGLNDDLTFVRAVDSSTDPNLSELGIPLTSQEAAAMSDRDTRLPIAISAVLACAGSISTFGGVWVDESAGGIVHVGLTQLTPSVESLIRASVPASTQLSFDQVSYTDSQLSQAQNIVTQLMISDPIGKSSIVTAMRQDKYNHVLVNIRPVGSTATVELIRNSLGTRLAGAAEIVVTDNPGLEAESGSGADDGYTPGPRDRSDGKLYGGEWIEYAAHGDISNCTVGYSATNGQNYPNNHFTITAGHCGGTDYRYFQGYNGKGSYVGDGSYNSFDPMGGSSNCDCVRVGDIPDGKRTGSVIVNPTDPNNGLYAYSHTASATNYTEGMKACLSGAKYGDTHDGKIVCGEMDTSSATFKYVQANFTLIDAGATDILSSAPGDSGGPYGNGGAFLGIHVGRGCATDPEGDTVCYTAFSKSTHIQNALSIDLNYPDA